MKMRFLIISLLLTAFAQSIFAQPGDDLPNDEIEVIKNFEARLAVSDKLSVPPQLPKNTDKEVPSMDYTIYPQSLIVDYEPPRIRPLAVKRKKNEELYKSYLELGYGTLNSPYLLGAYESGFEQGGLGIGVNHYSAKEGDVNHQRLSQTDANIKGNYIVQDQFNIFGGIDLGFDKRYYNLDYVDSMELLPDSTDLREINQFGIHAGIENSEETQLGIDYRIVLSYRNAQDKMDTKQNLFNTEFSFVKFLNDKNPIGIDFGNYLSTYKPVEFESQDVNAFYANPYFKFGFSQFGFRVGADVLSKNNNARVFPDVDLIVNLKNNELILFAETEAYYTPIDFIQNVDNNPFLSQNFEAGFQDIFEVIAGVRGNFNGINYSVKGGYQQIDNLPQYFNNPADRNKFLIDYDTATNVFVSLDLDYQVQKDLILFANFEKQFYDLENNEQILHTPEFRLDLGGKYWTLDRKLLLGIKAFFENGLYYRDQMGMDQQMDALMDISFDGKYLFTDHVGVFLQLNNITDNKRERWRHYPTFGFNALGGVMIRF